MTRGGNLTLIVILLILWFVGIFLAGYFGYEHFDKGKKSETNLVLFVLGVVLAIGTFIGIIVLFIKRSRIPKNPMASGSSSGTGDDSMKMDMERMPMMRPDVPGPMYPEQGYPAQSFPAPMYSGINYGMQSQPMMSVAPIGYPGAASALNPYLSQQYSI